MCYNNEPEFCLSTGKIYTLEAAVKCAPEGWHLPTDAEWQEMERLLGMQEHVLNAEGERSNSAGLLLWKDGGSGFDAIAGGYYNNRVKKFNA